MNIINFSKYFVENADYLSKELNIPITYNLEPLKEYIVFSAHDAAKDLLEFQIRHKTKYIIYQSENIESVYFKNKYYIELLKHNKVLNYSAYTAMKMNELYNISTVGYFQFNYKKMYSSKPRDIDLLFFGTMTQKRYDILKEIQNKFTDLKIEIVGDVFGDALTQLLLRTEYVINISAYDNAVLETHRINKAISCGCYIISNYSSDTKMNEKYKEYVYFCGKTISDYIEMVKIITPQNLKV
jgi:hypothetical protein